MQLLSLSVLFLLFNIPLSLPSSSGHREEAFRHDRTSTFTSETRSVSTTMPDEVAGMDALKESLRIPDRLGWEGDPCTPSSWDGVTCGANEIGDGFVIYEIDLANKGLKGSISGMISLLKHLNSLNLSSNCLVGEIPSGFADTALVKLDLSNNHLTGQIPQKLSSSRLEWLSLNDNHFIGWFPMEIYSMFPQGDNLNISGNDGLCGVGILILPQCSFWTMAFSSKKAAACLVGIIALFGYSVHILQDQYDQNNPNLGLVISYAEFRVRLALCILLFHFLRTILLFVIFKFKLEDSYKLMRYSLAEQTMFLLCGLSVFVAALRGWRTKISYLHTVFSCCWFSTALSFSASMAVGTNFWLRNLEKFWVLFNFSVLFALLTMPDAFDLKHYLGVRVFNPIREALGSFGWVRITYITIAFIYVVVTILGVNH